MLRRFSEGDIEIREYLGTLMIKDLGSSLNPFTFGFCGGYPPVSYLSQWAVEDS